MQRHGQPAVLFRELAAVALSVARPCTSRRTGGRRGSWSPFSARQSTAAPGSARSWRCAGGRRGRPGPACRGAAHPVRAGSPQSSRAQTRRWSRADSHRTWPAPAHGDQSLFSSLSLATESCGWSTPTLNATPGLKLHRNRENRRPLVTLPNISRVGAGAGDGRVEGTLSAGSVRSPAGMGVGCALSVSAGVSVTGMAAGNGTIAAASHSRPSCKSKSRRTWSHFAS